MKLIHVLLFIGCFCFKQSFSQPKENVSQLILALNPGECVTCLNELNYIDRISKNDFSISIVMKSIYRGDSSALVKNLFLDNYKDVIIFNDDLYQKYRIPTGSQESSITLLSMYGDDNGIKFPLSYLGRAYNFINSRAKKIDTLHFSEPVLGITKKLRIGKQGFFVLNKVKNEISFFENNNLTKFNCFTLTDSIAFEGYKVKFSKKLASSKYNNSIKYINRYKLIGEESKIINYDVVNDTIFVLLSQPNIIENSSPRVGEEGLDSVIVPFYTFLVIVDRKLIDIVNVEMYNDDVYADRPGLRRDQNDKGKYDSYFLYENFFIREGAFFIDLISSYILDSGENWAVAKFIRKENKFIFEKYQVGLPNVYIDKHLGYNYTGKLDNFENFFSFYLSDTLFNIAGKGKNIYLWFLDKDVKYNFLVDYKISGKLLWVLTNPKDNLTQQSTTYVYYLYNVEEGKLLQKVTIPVGVLSSSYQFPKIDPFDFNYIYYFVDEVTVVRYNVL